MSDEEVGTGFYDDVIDQDEAQSIQRRNQAPGGFYQTDPEAFGEFTDTPTVDSETGRRVVQLSGRATVKTRTGESVSNYLRYRISPDPRPKRDAEGHDIAGKDDLMTRLYGNAVTAYTDAMGESPKNLGQIVDYLKTQTVTLRCMPADDAPVVLGIAHPKGRRR